MKCFGIVEPGAKVGWFEKPIPEIGVLDALIRPLAMAPCSSDVHNAFHIGSPAFLKNRVLGHESVGLVEAVGSLVTDFKAGDRVVIPSVTPDWRHKNVQGKYHQHPDRMNGSFKFAFSIDGVFSEFFRVPDADMNLAHLPEDVSLEEGLMTVDMVSTGFHGVELAGVEFGDTVAVIGIGPVGLMAVAGAVLRGASRVFVVDARNNRFELAKTYGATDAVNYMDGDVAKQIQGLTNKAGVDRVIIAGGDADAFKSAIKTVRAGGTVANLNFFTDVDILPIPNLQWGSGLAHKTIVGGLTPGGRLRMEKLLGLVRAKRVDPTLLITHRFNSFAGVEPAFQLMVEKPADLIKPVAFL
ncbi:MAG: zinc-binding dehydrogenase [Negativicutes bacterium]|nr:zinc-binding dehydrogenase [Negativicutes bacterium]